MGAPQHHHPHTDNTRAIATMLAAVGFLSLMDAGLKLLAPHYPPLQVAALRAAGSWPIAVGWVLATTGLPSLLRVRWGLHLLRGVIGVAMMSSFAYGLRTLPLSTAYTIFFIAPIMIIAMSGPLLGERVGAQRWIAILAGFAGVLVAMQPSGEGTFTLAGFAIFGCATGYAISAITVRVLSRTDTAQSMVFWVLTMMMLGSGVLAAPNWVAVQPSHWLLVAGVGVVGIAGQYTITAAFARGEASVIAPFEYTALAWGLAFDLALWGVLPGSMTWVGAGIVIASGIYLMRSEHKPPVAEKGEINGVRVD